MITVTLTGASGYLGSWICRRLLEQNYRVHATVRDISDKTKMDHLLLFKDEFPEQLHLFEADLLRPGSFEAALKDADILIHSASPYFLEGIVDPQRQLVDPAVKGTRTVLETATRCPKLKRVIVTSSVASMMGDNADAAMSLGSRLSDKNHNKSSSLEHNPYQYSKALAEKVAREIMSAAPHIEFLTLHPGLILGPALSTRGDSESAKLLLKFLNGTLRTGVPDLSIPLVDVRDVAEAHLLAIDSVIKSDRMILVEGVYTMLEISKQLHPERFGFPSRVPKMVAPRWLIWLIGPMLGATRRFIERNVGFRFTCDNVPSREQLGLDYRAIEKTLRDHVEQLCRDGMVNP